MIFLITFFAVLIFIPICLFYRSDDIKKEDWAKLVKHDIDIKLSNLRIEGLEQRVLYLEDYLASRREREQVAKKILGNGIN